MSLILAALMHLKDIVLLQLIKIFMKLKNEFLNFQKFKKMELEFIPKVSETEPKKDSSFLFLNLVDKVIGLYPHQLKPYIVFTEMLTNELILRYPTGSGKTLTALITGFLMRKSQPFKKNRTLILTPSELISKNFKYEARDFFKEIYSDEAGKMNKAKFEEDFEIIPIEKFIRRIFFYKKDVIELQEKDGEVEEKIKKVNLTKEEKEKHLKDVIKQYSNCLIFVDEAHKLNKISGKEKVIYDRFQDFLKLIEGKDVHLIGASGTLAVDKIEEHIHLFNLFLKTNFDESDINIADQEFPKKLKNKILFMDAEFNDVAVRERTNPFLSKTVDRIYDVHNKEINYVPCLVPLNHYQATKYLEFKKMEKEDNDGFHIESRIAAIVALPKISDKRLTPEDIGKTTKSGMISNFFFGDPEKKKKKKGFVTEIKKSVDVSRSEPVKAKGYDKHIFEKVLDKDDNLIDVLEKPENPKLSSFKEILIENTMSVAAKFEFIQGLLDDDEFADKAFSISIFFIQLGVKPFELFLDSIGFTKYKIPKTKGPIVKGEKKVKETKKSFLPSTELPRYIVLEGSESQIMNLLEAYNDPRNKEGKFIRILIYTYSTSVGVSIFNSRVIIHAASAWNRTTEIQINNRNDRGLQSLKHFRKKEDRTIDIFYLTGFVSSEVVKGDVNSVDRDMYIRSRAKGYEIDKIDNILRKISIDVDVPKQRINLKTESTNFNLFLLPIVGRVFEDKISAFMSNKNMVYIEDIAEMLNISISTTRFIVNKFEASRKNFFDNSGNIKFIAEKGGVVYLHENYNEIFSKNIRSSENILIKKKGKTDLKFEAVAVKELDESIREIRIDPYSKIDKTKASLIFERYFNTDFPEEVEDLMSFYFNFCVTDPKNGNIYHFIAVKEDGRNQNQGFSVKGDIRKFVKIGVWETVFDNKINDMITNKFIREYITSMFDKKYDYFSIITPANDFKIVDKYLFFGKIESGEALKKPFQTEENIKILQEITKELNVQKFLNFNKDDKIKWSGMPKGSDITTSLTIDRINNIMEEMGDKYNTNFGLGKADLAVAVRKKFNELSKNNENLILYF